MVKKTLYKRLSEFLWKSCVILLASVLVAVGAYGMEKDKIAATIVIVVGAMMVASVVIGSMLQDFEDDMR